MNRFERLIQEKGKSLPAGKAYHVGSTLYKAGLMVVDVEDFHGVFEEAKKEFPLKRETAIFDKDATISLQLEWSEKVLEWYVKWLGT